MDKNFKTTTEDSLVKLTEGQPSENNSAVVSASKAQEPSSAYNDMPDGISSKGSKSLPTSKSQIDRRFDQFGLWILILVACSVTSGFLIPLVFPADVPEITRESLFFLLAGIACAENVVSLSVWCLLSRVKLHSALKFSIVVWLPALFAPLFFWNLLCVIPASRVRQSDNGTFLLEYLLYAFGYLVLPSLVGSTYALLGIACWSKFLDVKKRSRTGEK